MAVKFVQSPDPSPTGLDTLFSQYSSQFRKLADDWTCTETGEVSKVTLWVSFNNDTVPQGGLAGVHLSIHADVPASPPQEPYSKPGALLAQWDLIPTEFAMMPHMAPVSELFWDPALGQSPPMGADTQIWQLDCFIPEGQRFVQQAGTIYWLDAFVTTGDGGATLCGWKTSPEGQAPDAAVWTDNPLPDLPPSAWAAMHYPAWHQWPGLPLNLSFAIETIPVTTTTTTSPPPTTTTTAPPTTTRPTTTTTTLPPVETKYVQPPDTTPFGMDIRACNVPGFPPAVVVADDWPCDQYGRLTAIRLWCSYKDDMLPPGGPAMPFDALHLRIHADVPHGPREHSCPGAMLWEWSFVPGVDCEMAPPIQVEGEWFWDPESQEPPVFPGDHQVWMVVCNLMAPGVPPFVQLGTPNEPRVYWLAARAILPPDSNPMVRFGWKTSPERWNDAACYAAEAGAPPAPPDWYGMVYPPPHQLTGQPVGMAFAIDQQPLPYVPHPADTGPGAPNWRIGAMEVLAYANAFLNDDDAIFPGIPEGNRSAYVLRAAAIYLAHFQARYEDVGTSEPYGSTAYAARWQALPDA